MKTADVQVHRAKLECARKVAFVAPAARLLALALALAACAGRSAGDRHAAAASRQTAPGYEWSAADVTVTRGAEVRCVVIGRVNGMGSPQVIGPFGQTQDAAIDDARKQTADLGGDTLVLDKDVPSLSSRSESLFASGTAYRCRRPWGGPRTP